MEIHLNLTRHCIETASKREYERLVRQCFDISDTDDEREDLENRISALIYFLVKADFSDLRNQCRKIDPEVKTAVLVFSQQFKDMNVRIDENILYPVWKNK